MPTHVCRICGKEKDYAEFDKVLSAGPLEPWNFRQCKQCTHEAYKVVYEKPQRRRQLNESSISWKKRHPEQHAKLAREYRERYPEKIMAQNRLNYAIRKGRVKRLPCEVCGFKESHAHHVSYESKDWYNVKWLCNVCHEIEHG